MHFWWVNHGQTFAQEVKGNYIWSPKHRKDGKRNHFWETLREVQRGDLVFSYAHAHLQAVGVAQLPCYSCPLPDEFGKVGKAWDQRGWRVDVKFQRFQRPFRVSNVADQLAPLLPTKYSPIKADGYGNQGAYLAEISRVLARQLLQLASAALIMLMEEGIAKEGAQLSYFMIKSQWCSGRTRFIQSLWHPRVCRKPPARR